MINKKSRAHIRLKAHLCFFLIQRHELKSQCYSNKDQPKPNYPKRKEKKSFYYIKDNMKNLGTKYIIANFENRYWGIQAFVDPWYKFLLDKEDQRSTWHYPSCWGPAAGSRSKQQPLLPEEQQTSPALRAWQPKAPLS
uniref:Uncharacterized protein n=1 Tax=Nelumbo nucifera TaxID=4432 RepID=A0A822ZT13_NELNU|nr:TPA_asm: hypothetical protein HUJ06_016452 [Nelumbo nucifera]